jgi:hypothetical protein
MGESDLRLPRLGILGAMLALAHVGHPLHEVGEELIGKKSRRSTHTPGQREGTKARRAARKRQRQARKGR